MEKKKTKKKVKVIDIIPPFKRESKEIIPSRNTKEDTFFGEFKDLETATARREEKDFDIGADFDSKFKNKEKKGGRKGSKKILWGGAVVLVVIVLWYVFFAVLPEAKVRIVIKKVNWEFGDSVSVSKSISQTDVDSKEISGQIFLQKKNSVLSFVPSGKKYLEQKSEGEITIFNAYSSSPQVLVATTRFKTPDGKIFRLKERTTIPGAKISGGNIEPSSVKALVLADVAGKDYNIGPIEKLVIPGFEGNDKFNGFYGKLEKGTSGGFVGESPYPSSDDIKKAKEQVEYSLREAALSSLKMQIPTEFKFVDGSEKFSIIKEDVDSKINNEGKFSVLAEAEVSVMAFREKDVIDLMNGVAFKSDVLKDGGYKNKSFTLEYKAPKIDLKNGKMDLPLSFSGVFWMYLDPSEIKSKILGMEEIDLKKTILPISGVEKLNVSFWPFWVSSIPKDLNKVEVVVE